ncbi:MAG: hypothetical protein Q9181_007553 [Wetmoreana brouardii]
MGGERAGYVTSVGSGLRTSFKAGDRVCAWNATPYASSARVAGTDVCPLPDSIPHTIGASIRVVFVTAYYSIVDEAKLQKGQHINSRGIWWTGPGSIDNCTMARCRSLRHPTFGKFVEVGEIGLLPQSQITMASFDRYVCFVSVDLTRISQHKPEVSVSFLAKIIRLFEDGTLQPVEPVITVPIGDMEGAFRKIQSRSHIGKLVLEAGNETVVKAKSFPSKSIRLDQNGTYVVAGTKVMALRCDTVDPSQVSGAATQCRGDMPPIKGLINCVMVIQDSILEHMDRKTFRQGRNPKVLGTCNLNDTFSSSDLDFFVMLSSISGILGIRSQANYAAVNTFQDALPQAQAQSQFETRYTSLNLEMVSGSEVIVTSSHERLDSLHRQGGLMLSLDQVLALLEHSMDPKDDKPHQRQLVVGFDRESLTHKHGITLCQPMFSHVAKSEVKASQQTTDAKGDIPSNVVLAGRDPNEVHQSIVSALVEQIATIMAMDEEKVSLDAPTADLGLDSLVAVELKNWIRRTS